MAGVNFEQPSLNWDASDMYQEFQRFKQHVQFTFKGPLASADAKHKCGWLGMWIGQQGRELYKTFKFNEGEEDKPDVVLGKIEAYVRPRKNKRVSRYRATQRKQKEGETFDNFVKDLRLLIMDCEYHDSDDMLIDLIINGVLQPKIQERLLDQGDKLTLDKALEIGQQYELSQVQLKLMRGAEAEPREKIYSVKEKSKASKGQKKKSKGATESVKKETQTKCDKCGKQHELGKCPAFGATCHYCKKKNHWLNMCRLRRKNVNQIRSEEPDCSTDSESSAEELFHIYAADEESGVNKLDDKWLVNLEVCQQELTFRIDTGAKCNIMVKSEYEKLRSNVRLLRSSKTLKSYSNHQIKPMGTIFVPVQHDKNEVSVRFEIVNLRQENIINGDIAEQLGLLQRINSLEDQSKEELARDFPELVKTTGTLPGSYTIKVDENAEGVIHPPRRVAASLKPRVIEKLREMEENEYITPVREPTKWVSSMVVSLKNDKVRICIDPKDLNKSIKREHHPMKSIDDVIASIPDANVFSVLDAKSGFLQIKLDTQSSYLTTFNTPLGRYRWLRLPFGVKSAPEIYQRIMDEMLDGIQGAFVIIDDILIAAKDVEHHDKILKQVIDRATEYNLKLNYDKCKIRQPMVPYMGHILTQDGLKADPAKVKAIVEMPAPEDKEGVRRILGMVQYLAKFIPNLSQVDAPLRALLKADVPFQWNHEQEKSFHELKQLCSTPPVLVYYDVNKDIEIECDASKDGLGAVLLQGGRVIAYASRALTETEKRYAQIEKEMLSIVYSVAKFHCYVFGKEVTIFNDHRPLEQIFSKPLLSAPMRIQKMLMKLQWYDLKIRYRKGKEMYISDALSRAFLPTNNVSDIFENDMVKMISVSSSRYTEIQNFTELELATLNDVIMSGWPDTRNEVPVEVRQYWDSRDQLSVSDGVIYKGLRIVIPPSLRKEMLRLIHTSHLGIVKCKQRAREAMFWPGMNVDIESTVKDCSK